MAVQIIPVITFALVDNLTVKIINRSANPTPSYATEGSSGLDLRAYIEAEIVLQPMERKLVSTGLFIELPVGYEAQVRPRSGLAVKHGLTCLNSPGTVDSDYRGEIKVLLINLSGELQTILNGERIAQMVVQKVEKVQWIEVAEIAVSERGEGGFGHTGRK